MNRCKAACGTGIMEPCRVRGGPAMTEACAGTASISAGRFFEEPPSKNGVSSASALRQNQRR
ncbi:hypothetical protein BU14_0075s0026 [Porphyra umbilicalis]|uniref:Uncharacterized protein n=1 Tax=Porphyra umbilicalis TaxID=2786 RepID=A0A1X6PFL4_PORUM|nr:hypothetical protein BU14_0075s0026 [Porphyra umbilicalis]|eukprot:OSX79536.1 hypothetical protein BU14_0075s0026 [Porphyra umbilicalis]